MCLLICLNVGCSQDKANLQFDFENNVEVRANILDNTVKLNWQSPGTIALTELIFDDGSFESYYGFDNEWNMPDLNVDGTLNGSPSWMRAQIGPKLLVLDKLEKQDKCHL